MRGGSPALALAAVAVFLVACAKTKLSDETPCPEGTRVQTHLAGQVRVEACVRDGVSDGPYRSWYDSGKPFRTGQCREGKPDGSWREFYASNGALRAIRTYSHGVAEGRYENHSSEGVVILGGSCHAGKPDGAWQTPTTGGTYQDGDVVSGGDVAHGHCEGLNVCE